MVLLEQIFTIDKERIQRLLGQTTPDEMYQINENSYSPLSPAIPPDVFSIDATALKLISILFDNNLISAEVYHQVLSRYSA